MFKVLDVPYGVNLSWLPDPNKPDQRYSMMIQRVNWDPEYLALPSLMSYRDPDSRRIHLSAQTMVDRFRKALQGECMDFVEAGADFLIVQTFPAQNWEIHVSVRTTPEETQKVLETYQSAAILDIPEAILREFVDAVAAKIQSGGK